MPGRRGVQILILLSALWGAHAFAADPVCAKDYITLRKGPGNQHPISWKVARNMPFLRLERRGPWVRLQDLEGEEHWGRTSELSGQIRCVVVKTNVATLRKEPSNSAATLDFKTVDRYTPFKRIDVDREWIKVEDETGRQAWLHESQVWKPVTVNSISF